MRQENECVVSDWKLIPFTSNIEMLSGFPFDSSHFNDSEGKPLIRIRNIISGKTETFFSGEFSNDYLIRKGDILVGMDGDFHIKKWQGSESLLNQRILKLYESETSQINIDFFYYLSQPFLLKVHKRTAGTTVKHLSTKDFKNASFKIPSYKEQQKIAEILSTVDAKIEIIDQQITETQELKKGLMQRLLTKGIGHTEFKDSALGEIPTSWEVVKIGDVLKLGGGKDYKHLKKGIVPVYGTGGVIAYVDKCLYDGESVGIGRKGSIDKPVFLNGKFWTVDTLFYTHSFKGVIPFYIYVVFQSISWRRHSEATGVPSLSRSIIEPIKIPLPTMDEQYKIVGVFQSLDEKLEVLSEKKTTYHELKKGLMQQLLTGKVRVAV